MLLLDHQSACVPLSSCLLPNRLPARKRWAQAGHLAWTVIPLILLAAIGLRGVQATKRAAEAAARAEVTRAIGEVLTQLEEGMATLRKTAFEPREYPLIPIPESPNEAQALYAKALSAPAAEAATLFARIEKDYPESRSASGIPLLPMVKWTELRAASDPAAIKEQAEALALAAVETQPSVLTPELLEHTADLLREKGLATTLLYPWLQRWDEEEQARAMLRAGLFLWGQPRFKPQRRTQWWQENYTRGGSGDFLLWESSVSMMHPFTAFAGWADGPNHRWWIEPVEKGPRRLISEANLRTMVASVAQKSRALLPDYAGLAIRLDNFPVLDPPKSGELLADVERSGFEVAGILIHPEALRIQEQQQARWLAALLACAVITAAAGFWTMQKALQRERQLHGMKSNFVASISHELRAPVASMRVMAENLCAGIITDPARRAEYHKLIADECWRLSNLIENVLDLARIERDRKLYRFIETNVPALITDAITLMQPSAEKRRQQIVADLEPLEPPPRCDGLAVQRALVNLLDNGSKFSPGETTITVQLRTAAPDCWELSVSDQGPGIAPEEHARIFERFYRVGTELRRETQGAGIGLSIVQHIAQAHGGSVRVESRPGEGARFTLALPFHPPKTLESLDDDVPHPPG
jgi:signal transduction histidine kinase